MSEATLILQNMRGGCATVGGTVHTLFRVNGRRFAKPAQTGETRTDDVTSPSRTTVQITAQP
jgi:hypothetical protein